MRQSLKQNQKTKEVHQYNNNLITYIDLFKVVTNTKSLKEIKANEIIYQKEWSKKESELLIENYYTKKKKNWKKLSEIIQTKSPQQCCYRIKRLEEKDKINSFTKQDDLNIMKYVDLYGKDWDKIALSLPGFRANLIEDRYNSKLDPCLKRTKFSSEEDEKILNLYEKYGNNWKEIASNFIDRNSNMIKNRFYSVLKKKLLNSNNSGTSSYIDSHSIINSSLINSIEEKTLDYMKNIPNEFVFPLNEYSNYYIDSNNHNNGNDNNSSNDVNMNSIPNQNDLNIEMKDSIMYDNDSNNSGGIVFNEDTNNNAMKMDSFNEIYQKVFHNDIDKKREQDMLIDNHPHPDINSMDYSNKNDEKQSFINLIDVNDCNNNNTKIDSNSSQIDKISQTDDLYIESQRLEEILLKINGDEIINEYESVFPSIENEKESQKLNQLFTKQEKLTKYKEMLYAKLKKKQNDYQQLKKIYLNNNNNDIHIPTLLRQTLIEINDILLKLISIGKMRIVLKKQIFDFFQERNDDSNSHILSKISLNNNITQAGK